MASLFDRNGTWYAQFYDSNRSPSRMRFSLKTKRKRKARQKLTELEQAHEDGEFDPWAGDDPFEYDKTNADLTLREAFESYCEEKRKEGIKESTLDTYGGSWRILFERVGETTTLSGLTADEIENFIHDPEIKGSTQHKRYRHVRCVLRYFDQAGVLSDVSAPQKPNSLPTPVREDDLSALTAEMKRHYRKKRRKGRIRAGETIWMIPLATGHFC